MTDDTKALVAAQLTVAWAIRRPGESVPSNAMLSSPGTPGAKADEKAQERIWLTYRWFLERLSHD